MLSPNETMLLCESVDASEERRLQRLQRTISGGVTESGILESEPLPSLLLSELSVRLGFAVGRLFSDLAC